VWIGALFFCLFLFLPLLYLYIAGARDGTGLLAEAREILREGGTYRILGFTAGQASLSAFISVLLAFPGAYLISHHRFPFKRFLYSLTLVPFILPSIVVIICMISFYGNSGLINRVFGTELNLVYNFGGILLAHVFYNFSMAIRIVGEGWQRIDRRYQETAKSLGEGTVRTFFRITLPLLMPSVVTAFILIFIYCFLSFGIVLVFGGVRYATWEVKIYQEMYVKLDLMRASLYSFLQLFFSVLFIVAASRTILRFQVEKTGGRKLAVTPLTKEPVWKQVTFYLYGLFTLFFLLGPLVTMTIRSLWTDGGWSLYSFRALFDPAVGSRSVEGIVRSTILQVAGVSIGTALLSGSLTFVLALVLSLALRGRKSLRMESFFQIPLGISLVSLSIGIRLLYGRIAPFFPLVVVAQVFIGFPFVFRIIKTAVEELQETYIESAQSLGASGVRLLKDIKLPLLRQGLLNAYAYSLAIPFADLTAVLSIARGNVATFPVAIYRLIGFRSFDLALALGVIYMTICFLLFLWIDTTSLRGEPT
jgi:thiamine transport system permease protein